MKKIFQLVILFCTTGLYGQDIHTGKIVGKVTDEDGLSLPYVNVVLLHETDSSLVQAVISDSTGNFVFEEIKEGNYFLRAAVTGYGKFNGSVFTAGSGSYDAGRILLQKQSKELKEVSVTAIKPFVEHQFDKTIVNVENSIVNAGSTAMEVLKRSPGIVVGEDESIRLKGKSGTVVMIDGKPSPLSGEALATMLGGMPSGAISKIEIITNPSAKYDAAGSGGIINIVLKRDKQAGMNGSVNGSYGQGRYAKASAGFGLNFRNSKWSLYVNYNYAHRKGFNSTDFVRNFRPNGQLLEIYAIDIYASIPSDAHVPRLGADYKLTNNTTVGIQLGGLSNLIRPNGDNTTTVYDGNEYRTGSFRTVSQTDNSWFNFNGNFNVRHTFDSLGKALTLDIDYSRYLNSNNQVFATYVYDGNYALTEASVLAGKQQGFLDIYSFKTDYTQPLKKNATVEAGLKASYVKTDNNLRYFNRVSDVDYFDTLRSNHFIYSENINAGYLNINRDWGKFNLQLGIRAEQTLAKGTQLSNDSTFTRNYVQPFYSLAFNYKFNDSHELGLTISRRIGRPGYQQLNPFRRYVDRTTYGAGNPYLLPALTYSTDLSYTLWESLALTVNYSYTKDAIETAFLQDDTTHITFQTEVNIEKNESYNFSINYSKQVASWFQTSTELDAWLSTYTGNLSGAYLHRSRPSFYFNSTNTFILPDNFSVEVSGFYQHRLLVGILDINTAWEAGAGVQKKILKNKCILKLAVTDIFWKNTSSGGAEFANVDSHFLAYHETRVGTFSVTYNFGKAGAQVKKRSGSEEEKNRVKVGS